MKSKTIFILIFFPLLLLSQPSFAGLDEGIAAYKNKDYTSAIKEFIKAADQGDAAAQYRLGILYHNGQGVPQDYAQAATWYRKAADQGNALAQSNLGVLYDNGQGVPQDYAQATAWYRKAADQGNALAQSNLGVLYYNGQGVPQSNVIAYALCNVSATNDPSSDNPSTKN